VRYSDDRMMIAISVVIIYPTLSEATMSTTVTLNIPAISCGHCVATIQRETKEVPGVLAVAADQQAKTATFTLANEAALTDVKATLVEIGYPPAN
jgi:copper chaperone